MTEEKLIEKDPDCCLSRQINIIDAEINSQELFQTSRELLIRHGTELYRLRLTSLNKLILTK